MRSLHDLRRYPFAVEAHEWFDTRSITGERSGDSRRVAFTGHERWALRRDRHWTKTAPNLLTVVGCGSAQGRERAFQAERVGFGTVGAWNFNSLPPW